MKDYMFEHTSNHFLTCGNHAKVSTRVQFQLVLVSMYTDPTLHVELRHHNKFSGPASEDSKAQIEKWLSGLLYIYNDFHQSDKLETSSDFLIQRESKVMIICRKEPVGMTTMIVKLLNHHP